MFNLKSIGFILALTLGASLSSLANARACLDCRFQVVKGDEARKVLTAINGDAQWTLLYDKTGQEVGSRVRSSAYWEVCIVLNTTCAGDKAYSCVIEHGYNVQDQYDQARARYKNNLVGSGGTPVGPGVDGAEFSATQCSSRIDDADYLDSLVAHVQH